MKLICVSVSNLLIICILSVLGFVNPISAANIKEISYTVTITATVGEPKLTIYGYTSPYAQVQLQGIGVAHQVSANQEGYFVFNRVFLPDPTLRWVSENKKETTYPDLYLLSLDTEQHTSAPLFLPPLPTGPYEITVGPVTLSPTITLGKGSFNPQEQIVAQGQAIPHSQVRIYLANNFENKPFGLLLWFQRFLKTLFSFSPLAYLFPYQTNAYFIPEYQIEVNETGRFQFNLPATDPATWRVFASAYFLDAYSPKSNTLSFQVLNRLQWLLEKLGAFFGALWHLIKPIFWWIVILLQFFLVFLFVFFIKRQTPTQKQRGRKHQKALPMMTASGAKIFARAT